MNARDYILNQISHGPKSREDLYRSWGREPLRLERAISKLVEQGKVSEDENGIRSS